MSHHRRWGWRKTIGNWLKKTLYAKSSWFFSTLRLWFDCCLAVMSEAGPMIETIKLLAFWTFKRKKVVNGATWLAAASSFHLIYYYLIRWSDRPAIGFPFILHCILILLIERVYLFYRERRSSQVPRVWVAVSLTAFLSLPSPSHSPKTLTEMKEHNIWDIVTVYMMSDRLGLRDQ